MLKAIPENMDELMVRGGVALLVGLIIWSALVVAISLAALAGYSLSNAQAFIWAHDCAAVLALGVLALGLAERQVAALQDAPD
ncbi:hypothetical protein OSH11_20155 [Kaistia dalseonensis]|uniref:Uncharacterized protein n=1 Tax=Kaistia dalseonensis TaxID=410840 RepID=A0ABU0HBG1_9HYPH|nr:hypothetical protein [Kaistia dalseonensis]MCX5497029.1 hypothetical protein [Kaistia dalseonensis]MDQ0439655.1 hypothetical protein [Kaistia dalseonensis]